MKFKRQDWDSIWNHLSMILETYLKRKKYRNLTNMLHERHSDNIYDELANVLEEELWEVEGENK